MTTSPLITALLCILENPWAEKGYKDLKFQYEIQGRVQEAEAIQVLIEHKFSHVDDSTNSQRQ
jgi:hypothetical protein